MRANFVDSCNLSWLYWPIVMLGLYYSVPPKYGNLYCDVFNIPWSAALSYLANRRCQEESPSWAKVFKAVKKKLFNDGKKL